MMKYSLIYFFSALLLFSCSNQEKKSEDKLYQQVMDVHDDVMEQMGEIMRLEKKLDDHIDELKAEDSTENKQPRIEYLTTLKNNLNEANQTMMGWMRQFNNDMDSLDHDEKMDYLQEEKQKIQEVQDKVNTAINNANEALK